MIELDKIEIETSLLVLSALKRSSKIGDIRQLINELFDVKKEIKEDKDIIWLT